jgi:hypothetical protein
MKPAHATRAAMKRERIMGMFVVRGVYARTGLLPYAEHCFRAGQYINLAPDEAMGELMRSPAVRIQRVPYQEIS